ncbi:MAG: enoyl-CoA hydratase/isomerase family protein [Bacillota bacterium]
MDLRTLIYEKKGHVAVVTLNRPQAFNCLNEEMWSEMSLVQDQIENDDDVRAVVIRAAGDKFSAGIDISLLGKIDSQYILKNLLKMQNLYTRWENMAAPVICAVNGLCFGAGTELALACDIRIASKDAVFAMQEVNFGLSPDMGGSQRLTRLVGPSQAKRIILACEKVNAGEALRIGLVDKLCENGELVKDSLALAQRIAEKPPVAVKFAKKAINVAMESSLQAGLLYEQAQSAFCFSTEDIKEAVAAFFEKRKPNFKGK